MVDFRTIETHLVSGYGCTAWGLGRSDLVDWDGLSGNSLDLSPARTCIHIIVVVHDGIVDDSGTVDDFDFGAVMRIGSIVSIHISMIDATMRDKHPVTSRDIDAYVDGYSWAKRCPAIISAT